MDSDLQLSPHPHESSIFGLHCQRLPEIAVERRSETRPGSKLGYAWRKQNVDSLVKDEPRTQPIIPPVHLTPNDAEQRLRVDQYPYPILLDHLVKLPSGR